MSRKAKFIKTAHKYEEELISEITGNAKTDYIGQIGTICSSKPLELYGLYDVMFDDGQKWSFMRNQLDFMGE